MANKPRRDTFAYKFPREMESHTWRTLFRNVTAYRVFTFVLTQIQLACACAVAGISGDVLHDLQGQSGNGWAKHRLIYTEVISAITIFYSIFNTIPKYTVPEEFWKYYSIFPIGWFIAFGLMVNFMDCDSELYSSDSDDTRCHTLQANGALALLIAIIWAGCALRSLWNLKHTQSGAPNDVEMGRVQETGVIQDNGVVGTSRNKVVFEAVGTLGNEVMFEAVVPLQNEVVMEETAVS